MAADGGGDGREAAAVAGVGSITLTLTLGGAASTGEYVPGPAMPASLAIASNMSVGMLDFTIGSHRSHSAGVLKDRSALTHTGMQQQRKYNIAGQSRIKCAYKTLEKTWLVHRKSAIGLL